MLFWQKYICDFMGEINLSKYKIHTDLIIEDNTTSSKEYIIDNIRVSETKKRGNYITICFDDITDYNNREKVGKVLEKELKKLIKLNNINFLDECLVIGLGNEKSTPDSLGSKVLSNILITKHLFKLGNVTEGYRSVSGFCPQVMADTGMETKDIVVSIIKKFKPKFVIVIDALSSLSIERINKTIQLTDTGIHPGAGIGNNREELSKKTLGIPIIAIGVPTVVSATTIVNDTINYLIKHISYIKDNDSINRLSFYKSNYLSKIKDKKLTTEELNNLFGLFGGLNEKDKISLINEVLSNINLDLIVTPSEIDFLIDKLSSLIACSINNSLHRQIFHY